MRWLLGAFVLSMSIANLWVGTPTDGIMLVSAIIIGWCICEAGIVVRCGLDDIAKILREALSDLDIEP